ncbi:hypothetical protein E2562_024844 [Oryza meyeriana var. granulata]|uniref:Uncharacterized protein n=1 Tax=Oryza meyeriana var. granulata TaxID=110450 RepID=A0A6G1CI50_9ORYZ|nr:hypothetical protein E2562_024844 [Oryza meyeriana var. granulata]
MEAEEHGTLLRRVMQRAARAARAVVRISTASPSSPAPAASPGCSRLSRTPSLLDCMDDDDDGESSSFFYTPRSNAASSPVVAEVVHYSQPSSSPSPLATADIDRRAAEFIERFRRNESLELRYCALSSPLTPVKPPMSPDTYFKLSRLHHHHGGSAGVSPAPAYGRKSSLRPRRGRMSIKWPTAGKPTVRV